MSGDAVARAVAGVPGGAWGVGVSGGADSVALLRACCARGRDRGDLTPHVIHLDHELRGADSAEDAHWVAELARGLGVACTVARRSEAEVRRPAPGGGVPARMRGVRLRLFSQVCARERLLGVLLGHHQLDQAETVLQRLVRGSGVNGLAGMAPDAVVGGVRLVRPMLGVPREALRSYLRGLGQSWREDATNRLPLQQRNRVRAVLEGEAGLVDALTELAAACAAWRGWAEGVAGWPAEIDVRAVAGSPSAVARVAAARWLLGRGVPAAEMSAEVAGRLVMMVEDAASGSAVSFPGGILVRRRAGKISVENAD